MAKANVSRRWFVGVVGGSVLTAAATLTTRKASAAEGAPEGVGPALLRPLERGSRLARWTLLAVEPQRRGAVALVLSGAADHVFRLEILARDRTPGAARPPAETEHFAIFVQNGGDGWSPTHEEQGIAAMAVATLIERNEQAGDAAGFLTHTERLTQHADALLPLHQG